MITKIATRCYCWKKIVAQILSFDWKNMYVWYFRWYGQILPNMNGVLKNVFWWCMFSWMNISLCPNVSVLVRWECLIQIEMFPSTLYCVYYFCVFDPDVMTRKPFPNSLHWRHNDHDGVSNHHPHACLLNRLFRRRSKKTSKLRVTGLYMGNSSGPVNSPHKGPVTRKMFPFDDVIMLLAF